MDLAALDTFLCSCWLLGIKWPGERLRGVLAQMRVTGSGGSSVGGPASCWGHTPQFPCPAVAPSPADGAAVPLPTVCIWGLWLCGVPVNPHLCLFSV